MVFYWYNAGMKKVTITLPIALYERLVALAKANHRSLQGQLVALIEAAVKQFEKAQN